MWQDGCMYGLYGMDVNNKIIKFLLFLHDGMILLVKYF